VTIISQELLSAWSDPQDRCRCITREMLLLLKVVFLDPWLKVKALSFLSPLEKELLRAAIEEEAAVVSESIESSQEAPAKPPPTKELKESTNFLNCLMTLYSLLKMSS